MQLIEFETTFGLVAASEQALVDALRELLLAEAHLTADELHQPVSS